MRQTATAFIGIGSNLGDRAGNLLLAVRGMLDAGLKIKCLSNIYETAHVSTFANEPVQPAFLNMVAALDDVHLAPEELLACLLRVEYALGRRRERIELMKQARPIDLDLLLYRENQSDVISSTEQLALPHPRLHLRRFVLAPLVELAPDYAHPLLNQTVRELLENLRDASIVALWKPN